jgi:mRNA interferase RelE/StbE
VREPYRIEVSRSAEKTLLELPQEESDRLARAIDSLAAEPRPAGVVKLHGRAAVYRRRVGAYRIIYEIQDRIRLVRVIEISRRTTQTYRRLNR